MLVKGVKNGPSPDWLQRRLKAIGLRPINALVDITNYISYDRGRPLHVYDADKLKGAIRARLGRKGESFKALDGKSYDVDAEMCVIADDARVLGLGGVIGGEETGCTDATTNVFIESAYFDPKRTAQAPGRKLNIQSDARFRFERGVDPDFVVPGLELATRMVVELCGGSAEQDDDRRQGAETERSLQIRSRPRQTLERARAAGSEDKSDAHRAWHQAWRQRRLVEGEPAILASRHFAKR